MLQSKVAVITGGANGIGKGTAEKFLQYGADLAIIDLDPRGEEMCKSWNEAGYNTRFYKSDIRSLGECEETFARIKEDFSRMDILINNAGITRDASMKKMSAEQWQQVIDVNLTGVFNCVKAVIPTMIEQSEGCIINASSVVGIYGNFGQTNYVASKAGVIGMSKTWAREFGKYQIRVNAVAPGFIETDMLKAVPENVLQQMKDKSALRRLGQVDDVANTYLFLASDLAKFITGTVISVDGGLVI